MSGSLYSHQWNVYYRLPLDFDMNFKRSAFFNFGGGQAFADFYRKLSRTDNHLTRLIMIKKIQPVLTDHKRPEMLAEKTSDIQWNQKIKGLLKLKII